MPTLWESMFNGSLANSAPFDWARWFIPLSTTHGAISLSDPAVIGGHETVTYDPPTGMEFESVNWTIENSSGLTNTHAAVDGLEGQSFNVFGRVNHYLVKTAQRRIPFYGFYWSENSVGTVTFTATAFFWDPDFHEWFQDIVTFTYSNVSVPSGNIVVNQFGTTDIRPSSVGAWPPFNLGAFGEPASQQLTTMNGKIAGIDWTASINGTTTGGYNGQMGIVQVGDLARCSFRLDSSSHVVCSRAFMTFGAPPDPCTGCTQWPEVAYGYNGPLLDGPPDIVWYPGGTSPVVEGQTSNVINSNDSPQSRLDIGYLSLSDEDHFELTLMWKPDNGIWMAIGKLFWKWGGVATNVDSQGNSNQYTLTSKTDPSYDPPSTPTTPYISGQAWPEVWNDASAKTSRVLRDICYRT